jgi:HK97 family phage portal protein
MGLISRTLDKLGLVKRSSLQSPQPWLLRSWTLPTESGVNVNADTTLALSSAYRAMWVLSTSIASLPLNVYDTDGKTVKLSVSHEVNVLLNRKPHDLYTPFTFKQTMMMHLLTNGNCYIKKKKNAYNQVTELLILPLSEVTVFYDENREQKYFKYKSKEYTSTEIIHIVGMGFDGLVGKSPIAVSRDNIGLSLASQQYGSKVFKNGVFSSGAVEVPNVMKDDSYARFKESLNTSYGGLANAGKPMILEGGATYKQLKLDVQDAMFIEQRKMNVYEIARIYGVPPHILFQLDKSSFNNIESLGIEFVRYTLRAWCEMIESAFNCDLLRTDDFGKREVRFNLDAMLRGDSKSRAEYYKNMFNIGAFSPNDILTSEGFNEYEGGADKYVPLNMLPADMVREYYSREEKEENENTI